VRVILLHNPGAGSQAGAESEKLVEMLREAGHEVRYQSCKDDGWDQVLDEPADLIAVAGGDGTVSRVAKRMVGRNMPIAPLPAGTANNIARTLGLIGKPWEELVRSWPEARRVKLDVGIAEGPWGKRYFVEGVGAGLFACLLSSDPDRKLAQVERPDERVAQALEMLKRRANDCTPVDLEATLDGSDISGRYLLFEAVNLMYVGPNLYLAPDSQPGDGQLDVVLVTEAERERLKNYLDTWQDNRERIAVLPSHRGKHLRMQWDGFELHIDDQLWPQSGEKPARSQAAIDVRISGETVEFLAPPQAKKE
jgi:diacylglycerol kinase family enzyme